MKNIILLVILLIFINGMGYNQNKKKEIAFLNSKIDSLYISFKNEQKINDFILEKLKFKNDSLEQKLNSQILLTNKLENEIIILSTNLDSIKIINQELIKTIVYIQKGRFNSLAAIIKYKGEVEIDEAKYPILNLNLSKKNYIILDSTTTTTSSLGNLKLYFIGNYEDGEYLNELENYGIIILNQCGEIIFDQKWELGTSYEQENIDGNEFIDFFSVKLDKKERILLLMGLDGGGSTILFNYYDLVNDGNVFSFKKAFSSSSGWSTIFINDEKKIYLELIKIDPLCHYGCDSKYYINTYSLIDDKLILKKETRYKYPDYSDIGTNNLIEKIKSKEPSLLSF